MQAPRTTHDVLESLTPEQRDVLRRRFNGDAGEEEATVSDGGQPVPDGGVDGDGDGSGGVPAPAAPPVM